MKIAIVGSRRLFVENIEMYIPEEVMEIISGGAVGIDECAKKFAQEKGIKFTEFLPDYKKYGKAAPLKRNITIIEAADMVIAFWDGRSKGTKNAIDLAEKFEKPLKLYILK